MKTSEPRTVLGDCNFCVPVEFCLVPVLSDDVLASGTLFWHEQTLIPSALLVKHSLVLLWIGIHHVLHREER
jgi:hypothetical protein